MHTRLHHNLSCFVWLCISICLLQVGAAYAQSPSSIDSLYAEIETMTEDSNKIKQLFEISHQYRLLGLRKSALENTKNIIALSKKNDYTLWLTKGYLFASGYCLSMGKNETALEYATNALDIAEREKMLLILPLILNNVGIAHYNKGDTDKAMVFYKRGLELLDETNGDKSVFGYIANSLGGIYFSQKEYTKAQIYFNKMYDQSKIAGDTMGLSIALTNIGECVYKNGDIDGALAFYMEALGFSKIKNDEFGEGYILNNIGTIYLDKKKVSLAEQYFQQSLIIANKYNDNEGRTKAYISLGKTAQYKGDYPLSNIYCKKSLGLAKSMGSKVFLNVIYEQLAFNYEAIGNFPLALDYQKLFKITNDSLFNETKIKKLAELSIQYETQKKEAENLLLIQKHAKDKNTINKRNTIILLSILTLALVSLVAFILFWKNQIKQKYNLQLEQEVEDRTYALKKSNTDLEQFAYVCSHDLKEPLRNIHGFSSLINRKIKQSNDPELKEYIDVIQSSVLQMDSLIEGILEYSRIDKASQKNDHVDLNLLAHQVEKLLQSTLKEKKFTFKTNLTHSFKGNASLILLVLKNLVENAIKYNESEYPLIEINSKELPDDYQIEIIDNGIGIEKEYQEQIFTIFKRLHTRKFYKGAGIGLSICKKIIQNLGGKIWVESDIGKGSRFIFSIPK